MNTSATDALAVVLSDSPHAALTPGPFIRCNAMAISDTTMNTVPGRYSGCSEASMAVSKMPDHFNSTALSQAANGRALSRETTSNAATSRYGSQAAKAPTFADPPAWPDFRSISTPPIHPASHSARGGKSHGSPLGMSQPRLATVTTMAKPINAPSSDGNSGPRNLATSTYGTVSANEANNANGHTANPSRADLFLPKNRVMNTTSSSGISVPTMACSSATLNPTKARKPSHCAKPMSATAVCTDSSLAKPLLTPTRIGVPTAPNDTGVL